MTLDGGIEGVMELEDGRRVSGVIWLTPGWVLVNRADGGPAKLVDVYPSHKVTGMQLWGPDGVL